jgi:hypothetical protein
MSFYDWVADFCPSFNEQEQARASYVGMKYQQETASTFWNSINAERGYWWDANPWVWVVSFKRVEGR